MNQLMNNLLMGFDTLKAHKLRTFLTILGVIVGTSTVIVIAAFVSGINVQVTKEIEAWGTNTIYVYKFNPGFNFRPTLEERTRKPITKKEAVAIREGCPSVREVALFLSPIDFSNEGGRLERRIPIRYQDHEMRNSTLQGTWPAYERMGVVNLSEGRFFTEEENTRCDRVCVIGLDVAETLFPTTAALNREVLIDNYPFKVIGVLAKRDHFLVGEDDANNENKAVYIPYETCHKMYPHLDDHFVMGMAQPGELDAAVNEMTNVLRRVRKVTYNDPDNFGISTSDNIVEQFGQITGGIFLLMVAISSVGLLIGGIGVMNIMLVSVTERTKEIGIRKAIGARQRDIIQQFLIEAVTLTGIGGLLGIGIGWLLAIGIRYILPSYVPPLAPIIGIVVSVAIGVIFGLWPAIKAARLDPIEALRYE
ncbi:MAG TPA: ABC transporter permease [Acidobacteriota bacterium]|nr:ABC transporter permease [Acidobacteriota bacterium]HNH82545.1 ABC transporter permease [Acidobacteriota bacterium]HNJ39011.1 ABC transporter permease [Acidobacteriota bacterium]